MRPSLNEQTDSDNYLARPRFSCSISFSFLRKCLPFLAHLCKVTSDIPEA